MNLFAVQFYPKMPSAVTVAVHNTAVTVAVHNTAVTVVLSVILLSIVLLVVVGHSIVVVAVSAVMRLSCCFYTFSFIVSEAVSQQP
jgi:hypothetical protein